MTRFEALQIVIGVASGWGENAEEGFTRRILATDTDEDLRQIISPSDVPGMDEVDFKQAKEVRDLWQAIALLQKEEPGL